MDLNHAKDILKALADGIHPITGEVLSNVDSCNQVEVVRALHTVLDELNNNSKSVVKKSSHINAGKPWSESECVQLQQEFQSGMKLSDIAKQHGRSRNAIKAKLADMGLMDYSYYTGRIK
jgi:hypothetical protein